MTITEIIKLKESEVKIKRSDLVDVQASPLWQSIPGNAQTWRHACKFCGEILADDTHQYDLTDDIMKKYLYGHFLESHPS